jgi:hypothetical protein
LIISFLIIFACANFPEIDNNKVLLKDTLHAPDLCLTVVSIGRIVKAGYTVQHKERQRRSYYRADSCGRGEWIIQSLFRVEHDAISADPVGILTLHRRLGQSYCISESVNAIRAAPSLVNVIDDFPPFATRVNMLSEDSGAGGKKAEQAQSFGEEVHGRLGAFPHSEPWRTSVLRYFY